MNIIDKINSLPEVKRMVLVPADEREEELMLIAFAKATIQGDAIDKKDLLILLKKYSKEDQQCSLSCDGCKFEDACEQLEDLLDVL